MKPFNKKLEKIIESMDTPISETPDSTTALDLEYQEYVNARIQEILNESTK